MSAVPKDATLTDVLVEARGISVTVNGLSDQITELKTAFLTHQGNCRQDMGCLFDEVNAVKSRVAIVETVEQGRKDEKKTEPHRRVAATNVQVSFTNIILIVVTGALVIKEIIHLFRG